MTHHADRGGMAEGSQWASSNQDSACNRRVNDEKYARACREPSGNFSATRSRQSSWCHRFSCFTEEVGSNSPATMHGSGSFRSTTIAEYRQGACRSASTRSGQQEVDPTATKTSARPPCRVERALAQRRGWDRGGSRRQRGRIQRQGVPKVFDLFEQGDRTRCGGSENWVA